jgi:hypothetical protein
MLGIFSAGFAASADACCETGGVKGKEEAVMPKISIVYVTARPNPQWQWFIDSLAKQTTFEQREQLQLIFIDSHLWSKDAKQIARDDTEIPLQASPFHDGKRAVELTLVLGNRFYYLHVPPKPCAWSGPFRQTKKDWFCAANTRNTGFIVAEHPYVVFVDDLSVLGPQWFNQVLHAAQDQYVVCGAYKKVKNLKVDHGRIESYDEFPAGVDTRWDRGSDGGIVDWHGSAMFGCSFGVALEAALEVDGNDAACNGAGAEDYDFGIRLERAGWSFKFNRNMLTLESEELHHDGSKLPQGRKLVTPDRLPKGYESYQHCKPEEKYWSDHVMLNRLANETDRILPLIGDDLRTLRERYRATGMLPIPAPGALDWRDGQPLSEQ